MKDASKAAYGTDLAFIHDDGFGHVARNAAEELLGRLGKRAGVGGLVVDLGCGSGILAERITKAGYDVLGFDLSPGMVELARRRAPRAEFRCQSLIDAELPPCVAITSIGEVFNYLFDPRNTSARLNKLFKRIHAALSPGGLFMFDFAGPGRAGPPGQRRRFIERDDWVCLVDAAEEPARKMLTRNITSFRRAGKLWRREHEVHRLRLYEPAELIAPLRTLGFRVRPLKGYNNQPFPPGWTTLVATRPA